MFTKLILLVFFSACAAFCENSPQEMKPSQGEEPVYKLLFESGFYKEAIEFLEEKAKNPLDTACATYNRYLFLCYLLNNQTPRAVQLLNSLFDRDSLFTLDSVSAPPNAYSIFLDTKLAWQQDKKKKALAAFIAAESLKTVVRVSAKAQVQRLSPLRAGLYCVPFGTGQFIKHDKRKATLLLFVEGATLGMSLWAYNERAKSYSPEYGWYSNNQRTNHLYLNFYRVQFGIFAAAHLYGVLDAFLTKEEE
jgi:hypothetical protein